MFEDDELVAIASEEVSLNRLFPGKSLATIGARAGHVPHVATIDLAEDLGHRREPPPARVRGAGRGRRRRQSGRTPPHRRRAHSSDHGARPRLGRLLLRRPHGRAAVRGRRERRLGPRGQHVPRLGRRPWKRGRDRRRRDPRRRRRRPRQHRLAGGTGHEGRHALLRRQRELHGRLHDVRRPARDLRRLRASRSARTSTAARSTSAGSIESLGTDAMQVDLEPVEEEDVLAFLDRYEIAVPREAPEDRQRRQEPPLPAHRAARPRDPVLRRLRAHGLLERRRCRRTSPSRRRSAATGSAATGRDVPCPISTTSRSSATSAERRARFRRRLARSSWRPRSAAGSAPRRSTCRCR